jgi:hypothetical protein
LELTDDADPTNPDALADSQAPALTGFADVQLVKLVNLMQ